MNQKCLFTGKNGRVQRHFGPPGLPPAEPHALTVRSGDHRVDVQSALAMLAPEWGFGQLIDITDEEARDNLARASVMALSFVASARSRARYTAARPRAC